MPGPWSVPGPWSLRPRLRRDLFGSPGSNVACQRRSIFAIRSFSSKSFSDVERDRERCVIHLIGQLSITLKRRPDQQDSYSITLLFRSLPDAQILKSRHTHVPALSR